MQATIIFDLTIDNILYSIEIGYSKYYINNGWYFKVFYNKLDNSYLASDWIVKLKNNTMMPAVPLPNELSNKIIEIGERLEKLKAFI